MKKFAALFLVLTMVLGCSIASSEGSITINLWHLYVDETNPNRIVIEEQIEAYMAAHPNVTIEQHFLQDADYKDKLTVEFSGSASSIDVFTYWGAGRAGDIVKAGKILQIEDYLNADKVSLIKPGADNNFRYDGKLFGLPTVSWMMVLYCNTELFEAQGLELPETYDQWLAACKTFAEAGIIPVALGGGVNDAWQAAFVYEALAVRTVGAEGVMELLNGGGNLADSGYEAAAVKMMELADSGAFGISPLEIDEVTANVQFLTGAAAMRLTGSWFTNSVYTDVDSAVEGKIKAVPIPVAPDGNGKPTDYVGGFIDGIFVNAATENPEVASDFAYELALAMAISQHEDGDGFSAFNADIDESGLFPLGVEVAELANNAVDGVCAWDTLLSQDMADVHVDACQVLLRGSDAGLEAFKANQGRLFE